MYVFIYLKINSDYTIILLIILIIAYYNYFFGYFFLIEILFFEIYYNNYYKFYINYKSLGGSEFLSEIEVIEIYK